VQLLEAGIVFRGKSSQVLVKSHFLLFLLTQASNWLESKLGTLHHDEVIDRVSLLNSQRAYS